MLQIIVEEVCKGSEETAVFNVTKNGKPFSAIVSDVGKGLTARLWKLRFKFECDWKAQLYSIKEKTGDTLSIKYYLRRAYGVPFSIHDWDHFKEE